MKVIQSFSFLIAMKIDKFFIISICLLLSARAVHSQEEASSLWLEILEDLSDEEDRNWENELEELEYLQQTPINLNNATKSQLEQLPFLNDLQIENLLAYIYLHGEMQTIYELQLVEEMDKHTIELLLPFVCIKSQEEKKKFPSLKNIINYGKHELLTRLDHPFYTREGYRNSYLGTKQYHSLRYSFRYGNLLQAGITAEKDAGEPLFGLHNSKGYDHYGFYLQLKEMGLLENLVLGNYRLSFGQGLIAGNNFHLGKTSTLTTSHYQTSGIRKHASTDEYNYFSGVATTIRLHPTMYLSAFYSYRLLDAVIQEGVITSIDKAGLHRTQNEANKINTASMQAFGGNFTYNGNRWRIGASGIYYFFDKEYQPNLREYSKYNLQGNYFYNFSVDYQLRLGRFDWRGEAAKGKEGYATLNQLSYTFSPDYKLMLIHRYYSHDYWAFYAQSFGESSKPQNENGWYLAGEIAPFAQWRFFASIDLFSSPWWKYRISKSSQGVDVMTRATYTPSASLNMYINYRFKRKERDITGSNGKETYPTHQHKIRYRLTWTSGKWQLRTTADYNLFRQQTQSVSQGWIISQTCNYTLPGHPLSINLQGSYFHTDDYDSRVYSYEKGLLNTFYTPSFYGEGIRYSLHLRYDWKEHITILFKWGETIYKDRTSIGSGNELIANNQKADMQLQLRMKF